MRLPGPFELFRLPARLGAAVELALGAAPQLVELQRELNAVVLEARAFITEARLTQRQAALLVAEVEITRQHAHAIADNASRTEASAAAAVREVEQLVGNVRSLLGRFEPALRKLAPITDFVADTITVDDAEALTALIHSAPELVERLTDDVLPVLDSLDTVGADLREVMDNTQQMDEMLGAVPGMGRVKKRMQKEHAVPTPPPAESGPDER